VINYTAYTLVDITQTNESRIKKNNTQQYLQQQNLNTLIQSIGIRSQPVSPSIYTLMAQDIVEYGFGTQYQGLHTVWRMDFGIEHTDVFSYNNNKFYHLINDTDGIAIVTKLEETAELKTKCFETSDARRVNLLFKRNYDML